MNQNRILAADMALALEAYEDAKALAQKRYDRTVDAAWRVYKRARDTYAAYAFGTDGNGNPLDDDSAGVGR